MKTSLIKTLLIRSVVMLFVSGSLFAQEQGTQEQKELPVAYPDPHKGMTIPAGFIMPTNPTIGVVAENGSTFGIYKKVPARIRGNEVMPPTGPEAAPDDVPNYWNVNISYYTDPDGSEFSVKYLIDNGIEDRMPVVTKDSDIELLEQQMDAWHTRFEAEHK